jgi:hypothetical protein
MMQSENGDEWKMGMLLQYQQTRLFKKVEDLLGGTFILDVNSFAERDAPVGVTVRNDADHPDRIVRTGDRYGYDYIAANQSAIGWLQWSHSKKRLEYAAAASVEWSGMRRVGLMRNDLFPKTSAGSSGWLGFVSAMMNLRLLYKHSGRQYGFASLRWQNRPPLFDDVFISPRTRNEYTEPIHQESLLQSELGWQCSAPKLRIRASLFSAWFTNGMQVLAYYDDRYATLVNDVLTNMNHLHYGIEWGLEWKYRKNMSLVTAGSMGQYMYINRPALSVISDNDAYVFESSKVYQKNYRTGGGPQQAIHAGWKYQDEQGWYINLSANWFGNNWLDPSPLRRTYAALEHLTAGSAQREKVLQQTKLPDQSTIDLSAGTTSRPRWLHRKRKITMGLYGTLNNLLHQTLVTGGFEQLRFDTDHPDPERFPPKYYYQSGIQFSLSIRFSW